MKIVFAGNVYEMLLQPGSLIFAYCSQAFEENGSAAFRYKMLSLESGELTDVGRNVYQLAKFGGNYRSVVGLCVNYVAARSLVLPSGKVFVTEQNGHATLFDDAGQPTWTGDLLYRDHAPGDLAIWRNTLWACYPDGNVLLRFNPDTLRQELRIGGARSPFARPGNLFIDGDDAVVSNSGSNKLLRVRLTTYDVEEYKEFSEPVYSYVCAGRKEFVLLESGIYQL